jgi:hypothetical protein
MTQTMYAHVNKWTKRNFKKRMKYYFYDEKCNIMEWKMHLVGLIAD